MISVDIMYNLYENLEDLCCNMLQCVLFFNLFSTFFEFAFVTVDGSPLASARWMVFGSSMSICGQTC